MKILRYACVALAAIFLLGAVVSFFVLFDRIETTTTVLAAAATAFAFLAYGMLVRERTGR